jgi:hypothetical protein
VQRVYPVLWCESLCVCVCTCSCVCMVCTSNAMLFDTFQFGSERWSHERTFDTSQCESEQACCVCVCVCVFGRALRARARLLDLCMP